MDNITLTRKDTRDTVSLPPDMRWLDEYGWAAVAQAEPEYTLGGAIVVQQGVKHAGRPITLGGEWAWLDWQTVQTLRAWCDVPGQRYPDTLRRPRKGRRPLHRRNPPDDRLNIRFRQSEKRAAPKQAARKG